MRPILRLLIFTLLISSVAHVRAQTKSAAAPGLTAPIVVRPSAGNTEILIRSNSSVSDSQADPQDQNPVTPATTSLQRWARPAGGFFIVGSNFGVLKSNLHITSDKVLYGNASEFGFGLGAQLDFGLPGSDTNHALRIRAGFQQMSITPNSILLNSYSAAVLENSAKTIVLAGLYRVAPRFELDFGTFWYGGGLQLDHVFSTSRPGQGGQQASALKSSYGFNLLAAVGMDFPVSDTSDVGVEMDWRIFKGLGGVISLRSSL